MFQFQFQLLAVFAVALASPLIYAQVEGQSKGAMGPGQPPDFATIFSFQSGYKNVVTLKTVDGKREFRIEGERCFVEATFDPADDLGAQPTAWIIPATTYARASVDEKFCSAGTKIPVLLHKEPKKSLFGADYRLGEFKWGRFSGAFEVK